MKSTMEKSNPRISYDQRQRMLEFMQAHEDFAKGRICGPDGSRSKKALMIKLADCLNSLGTGATKSPEKWYKCWQDWKSDVKAKALKIKKSASGTGGGPRTMQLSSLETMLLDFVGIEVVDGLNIPDPFEVSTPPSTGSTWSSEQLNMDVEVVVQPVPSTSRNIFMSPPPPQTNPPKKKYDDMETILLKQAVAIEELAKGINKMVLALDNIADAIRSQSRIVVAESEVSYQEANN